MWDATYGFGGNGPYVEVPPGTPFFNIPGRTGGGCVLDGPFKDMVVNMGPGPDTNGNPRCLTRDFSPYVAASWSGVNMTNLSMKQKDFGWFNRISNGLSNINDLGIHGGGHFSVGGVLGTMGDMWNSPSGELWQNLTHPCHLSACSDPVFYLHHANLDRLWWSWQKMDLSRRLTDISGPINYADFNNIQGGNVTLDFPIGIGVNAPNVTVRDVMDIGAGVLCYDYDQVYKY